MSNSIEDKTTIAMVRPGKVLLVGQSLVAG